MTVAALLGHCSYCLDARDASRNRNVFLLSMLSKGREKGDAPSEVDHRHTQPTLLVSL